MSAITVTYNNGGTAWVSNPNPAQHEIVTLFCQPDTGRIVEDIEARDEHGQSVAFYVQEVQTFTWRYETLDINVTFSRDKIVINIDGDGTATVSNYNPNPNEVVLLTIEPSPNQKIFDVKGWDENGNLVTFNKRRTQAFMWIYDTLDILVTFKIDNSRKKGLPIWMYPRLRKYNK